MKRTDLIELEKIVMKETVRRRNLGGYSMDAEGILILCETLMKVVSHMVDEYPEQPKPEKKAPAKKKSAK